MPPYDCPGLRHWCDRGGKHEGNDSRKRPYHCQEHAVILPSAVEPVGHACALRTLSHVVTNGEATRK